MYLSQKCHNFILCFRLYYIFIPYLAGFEGKMLLFDALECSFRRINLRSKIKDCIVCGENPSITAPIDYLQFCGSLADDKVGVNQFHLKLRS